MFQGFAAEGGPDQMSSLAEDLRVPRSPFGIAEKLPRLALGRLLPAVTRLLGDRLAVGEFVVLTRHADIVEVLRRDLDFLIAPVNAERMDVVNGPFILGMDRSVVMSQERAALYRALARVDMAALRAGMDSAIEAALDSGGEIDAVGGYARPVAAGTAIALFGLRNVPPADVAAMTRVVFQYTFLDIPSRRAVVRRGEHGGELLRRWLGEEIDRRVAAGAPGEDLMGQLLRDGQLDHDGVRRTLGGMLVGAIDTTATAVAKIVKVMGRDRALQDAAARAARDGDMPALSGWCWEALRRWPQTSLLSRVAAADTVLDGLKIPAGARLLLLTEAAMNDPGAFPDPRRSLPDRHLGSYLHFGGGIHPCGGRSVNAFQIPGLVGGLLKHGPFRTGRIRWAGPFPDVLPVTWEGGR